MGGRSVIEKNVIRERDKRKLLAHRMCTGDWHTRPKVDKEVELKKLREREKEIKEAKRVAKSEKKAKGNEEKALIEDEKKREKNRKKKEKRREKEERKDREEQTELSNSFNPLPPTDALALPLETTCETLSLESHDQPPSVKHSPPRP